MVRKGFLSVTGNGVNHPNDYGHRLYADVLTRDLLPDTTQEWPPPALASNSRHPLPPPPPRPLFPAKGEVTGRLNFNEADLTCLDNNSLTASRR
ncbi:hypothetical protein Ga0100230_000440 [Opitutaceae bacterium TAV3]|nr:hypothetical protein Ga0100230_000440 [Opitutaceae bacterium TAV3]